MGKKHKSKKHHKKGNDAGEEKSERLEKADKGEKPIKLVLKVGTNQEKVAAKQESPSLASRTSLNPEKMKSKEHSSKKKKKKRSSSRERKKPKMDHVSSACASPSSVGGHERSKKKRDRQEMEGESSSVNEAERPIKKIYIKPIEPPIRNSPEVKKVSGHVREPEISPLQLCLENVHRTLQRKDTQGFFAYPVNDTIAPGYSNIITHPMDFSSMKYKIDSNDYLSIEQFRDDFYLMCNNAMVYNAPETIYYKAAKKLLQTGSKLLSPEKVRNMYHSIGFSVPDYEGNESDGRGSDEPIDVDTVDTEENHVPQSTKRTKPRSDSKHTSASRKILAQVQEASKRMAAELEAKHANSKVGFLRRDKDGTTTLAVVNPVDSEVPEYLNVNLGTQLGKVVNGSHTTAGFKEDKRNKATPVSYLMYGPYGSFAPTYDSSRATITKEHSDLLYSTYGDDTGIHYAKSLQAFVKDASSFSHEAVDRLLDVLTDTPSPLATRPRCLFRVFSRHMAPSFVLLLCPVVTVMAMRASEGSEQEGWPFSSDDVVITRQYDSTSGSKLKMDYVELFKSMWKKIPYDVKMSGNSWSIVDLMLTKPTLAFDCEEANQDSDIFLVMSELPSELSKDSRVSEENVVGMLDDVSRVFEQINEVFDYKVDVPNMAKSFYNGMSLQEALDKVMQAGEDLRSTITEKKQNLLGGFAARKWKSAFSFYKGTHVQAFLTTKPPVQYGKTAVKLKCYKAQSTRLLGFEGSKETSSFLPFTAKHFALMVLDVAV